MEWSRTGGQGQVFLKNNAESPMQGSKRFSTNTKTIHFAYLVILIIYGDGRDDLWCMVLPGRSSSSPCSPPWLSPRGARTPAQRSPGRSWGHVGPTPRYPEPKRMFLLYILKNFMERKNFVPDTVCIMLPSIALFKHCPKSRYQIGTQETFCSSDQDSFVHKKNVNLGKKPSLLWLEWMQRHMSGFSE